MQASRWQYFFAREWLSVAWFSAFALIFGAKVARLFGWPIEFHSARMVVSWIAGIVGAILAGLLVALILGAVLLGPIYRYRARLNGAPFRVGDHVEILRGKHRGRVVRVRALWPDRGQLRVDLGDASATVDDVFSETAVRRAQSVGEASAQDV